MEFFIGENHPVQLAVTIQIWGPRSESGTCSRLPFPSPEVGSYKGRSLLPLRPFDFPPSPRPHHLCSSSSQETWNLTFKSTLPGAWAAQGRSSPNAPTPPPPNNSPLNPLPVRPDNTPVPFISLILTLLLHSHEADRKVRSHRPSEEKRCARKGWSGSRHRSCKAQRYDPTFRFQLQKGRPRACPPRTIKATARHRTGPYSSLLL